jgi:hypothetical protein
MQNINTNLLSSLSVLLPDNSIKVLLRSSTILYKKMTNVFEYNLYWKIRTENLLNVYLKDINIDWQKAYNILNKAIKNDDPFLYVMDYGTADHINILLDANYDPTDSNAFTSSRVIQYMEIYQEYCYVIIEQILILLSLLKKNI